MLMVVRFSAIQPMTTYSVQARLEVAYQDGRTYGPDDLASILLCCGWVPGAFSQRCHYISSCLPLEQSKQGFA